ncbi:MAG: serine/threonine-protein kinase [Planctomycetota bacterium]
MAEDDPSETGRAPDSLGSRDDPATRLPEELEAAVYDILFQAPGTEQEEAVDRLCSRHAEHEEELRRLVALVRGGSRTLGGDAELDEARPGSMVGPYKIVQKIGEGGFGAVFLAEQREPIERQVALKLLLPGMDSRQILLRFEAERRALARLDHPNIARVLDAGKTERGHPYFVMEYVPGVPITRYCDEHRLPLRARLELFLQVCSAVQHSHQKGILHRDLKPSNLLVTLVEGEPRTKVIDFGVAKALTAPLTEATLQTEVGRLLGTPEYMSPEQAEMSPLDVDTRTDIYSLGVLLYELLTGCLPFSSEDLRSKGFGEVRRLLREVDPPTPSRRLGRDPEAATRAAARSGTSAPALLEHLRGDLDWIVQKATDKDRTRRYESVGGMAEDLQRFLDGQPVLARPPSASYRLRKLWRRRRGEFVGAAVALVSLVGGLVASLLLWLDADHNWRLAQQKEGEARQHAEDARRNLETAERNAAEASRNAAEASRNATRAEEAAAEARSNLADYERLADLVLLDRAVAAADQELWPELPARLPAIDAWLGARAS